jgi:hypothetical protein
MASLVGISEAAAGPRKPKVYVGFVCALTTSNWLVRLNIPANSSTNQEAAIVSTVSDPTLGQAKLLTEVTHSQ